MSKTLPIAQLGDRVLRQQAQSIEKIESVQPLIDELIATAAACNGVGIAAPQVGQSYRLLIVASRPTLRYLRAPKMEPTAMINPRIIAHSDEIVKDWEGCLSIPGIRGWVPRYRAIEVEYTTRDDRTERRELTDFVARIFQHEYDHLGGLVFLDRLESTRDIITEQEYQKQIVNDG